MKVNLYGKGLIISPGKKDDFRNLSNAKVQYDPATGVLILRPSKRRASNKTMEREINVVLKKLSQGDKMSNFVDKVKSTVGDAVEAVKNNERVNAVVDSVKNNERLNNIKDAVAGNKKIYTKEEIESIVARDLPGYSLISDEKTPQPDRAEPEVKKVKLKTKVVKPKTASKKK